MELAIAVALIALGAFVSGWMANEWFNWKELAEFCKSYGERFRP